MPRQWTQQQLNAIYATEGSVLVSAAAGSGKTAVLVERVINLITRENDPLDVDRLLIVTFTRDAAAQMKDRISLALNALLEKDPYNSHLLKQKQLLYNASISTIDSFCSDIVREYFHTLNIARDYRIAENGELDILSKEAMNTVFEDFYKHSTQDFLALVDAFASKQGDEKLRQTVLKVAEFLSTQPFPDKWLDDMLENYIVQPIVETIWGKIILENSHSAVSHTINLTENSINMISKDEKLSEKWLEKFEEELTFLTVFQKKLFSEQWDDISVYINSYSPSKLMPPKGYKDNPIKLSVASNRDEVKSTIKELQQYFSWTQAEASQEISELFKLTKTLFSLVKAYNSEFALLKNKKNILSFSDIEQLTVQLLAKPCGDFYNKTAQAQEISSRYDAVMVDEFQDVNYVQDLIFKCVSKNEANLFVVGDVKQSIYGFRQAKPEIFINRKKSFERYNENKPSYPATIILDKNFRSRDEVCSAVNFIFSRLMTKSSAKMDYNSDEMLNIGAVYPKSEHCDFEISLLEKNSFNDLDTPELEAYYIADKIHKMISSGFCVQDNGTMRKATYGDFAIIMRSPKSKAMRYVSTLINCGIPAYSEIKESFFDALEVKIMLNLLRVIDNPTLEIPLLSVMCSPIYGFTSDELALIRSDNRHTNLYSSLKSYALNDEKTASFLSELTSIRNFSSTSTIDELISNIYEVTSFKAISLAVTGNEVAAKNLNLLREYARAYESNGYKTLSDFISYVDKLVENGTELSASSSCDCSINSVRVLSIHSSKGLEYPVCFIADTAHGFNKNDLKNDILIDSRVGLGVRRKSDFVKYDTLPRLAVCIEMKENEIAEELRVLYVALTRAKEKLIVVSSHADVNKYLNNLYSKIVFGNIIEPYTVKSCKSISDWICLCALVHPSLNSVRKKLIPSYELMPDSTANDNWKLQIVQEDDFLYGLTNINSSNEKPLTVACSDNNIDINYAQILHNNLNFKYKNQAILNLPQKVTASDIAHAGNNDYFEKILLKPSFLNNEMSSSVEKGTAHHVFLQHCDFENAKSSGIDNEVNRMINSGLLSQEQADYIDRIKLYDFVNSSLASRIMQSNNVMREERFISKIKPSFIFEEYNNIPTEERIIIQGAVDLAFEEDGKLVIVDYKTDRVGDIEKLLTLYSKQLELYKEAMEQSTELAVKECILYSIHLNKYISV